MAAKTLVRSARAALMTRGFVEMQRFADAMGGRAETLAGLSGFGDLVLTCGSHGSRNFRFGYALGAGALFDPSLTVEGVATAKAVSKLAKKQEIEMPITHMIAALLDEKISLTQAIDALMWCVSATRLLLCFLKSLIKRHECAWHTCCNRPG